MGRMTAEPIPWADFTSVVLDEIVMLTIVIIKEIAGLKMHGNFNLSSNFFISKPTR